MCSVLELREVWAGYPIPSKLVVLLPGAVFVGLFSPRAPGRPIVGNLGGLV